MEEEPRRDGQPAPVLARRSFLSVATEASVIRRALGYAVVVGSVLIAINQGDVILAGEFSLSLLIKSSLTFCVPYCVSTASSVGAIRSQQV